MKRLFYVSEHEPSNACEWILSVTSDTSRYLLMIETVRLDMVSTYLAIDFGDNGGRLPSRLYDATPKPPRLDELGHSD